MTSFKKAVLSTVAFLLAANLSARVVDVEPERGRRIPSIPWIDETGRVRQLSEFAGFPVILLPVYTRCQTACITNVDQLKKTLADAPVDPTQFRVILFSFDPTDTPSSLAAYRQREKIPLAWSVGTASQPDVDVLLDSIGFQVGRAGTEFVHANLLLFLDSKLRIAKWLYGTDYSSGDVETGLKVADGKADWIGQYSQWLYAVLLFGASALCVVLGNYLIRLNAARSHASVDAAL